MGEMENICAGEYGVCGACIVHAIGNTPLLHIEDIYAKLETFNATGSVKDRMAWFMVRMAEERGELKPGATMIEVTSGNTGIALSMIAAHRGYKFKAVMPEHMSAERIRMMEAFGAEVILTPKEEDMEGAVREYHRQVELHPDAWLPCQFANPDNVEAHRIGIGREIIRQMELVAPVDALVAGIGTGGTLIGSALALREKFPNVRIIGVEPAESAVLNGQPGGPHSIEGTARVSCPSWCRNTAP